jgi:hypothetical protein
MLIEYLGEEGFEVISANTDGIITKVPVEREEEYYNICKQWEEATSFDLEYTYYKKYARRDVNNYLSITTDGDVKTKGDFTYSNYKDIDKDKFVLMRGFDKPIIALAINNFLIDGKPIEETIRNHKDIYDFCTSKKTDKKFKNEYHTLQDNKLHIQAIQQSVRYYVSKKGGKLYKRLYPTPDKRKLDPMWFYEPKNKGKTEEDFYKENPITATAGLTEYCVSREVTLFNDYIEKEDYDIDYGYYINETQKIIDQVIKPQFFKKI